MAILDKDKIYYFSEFIDLPQPPEEILAELGFQLRIESLELPTANKSNCSVLDALKSSLWKRLQLTPLTSEQARRETLVSPVLFTVAEQLELKLLIEYPVSGKRAKGTVDYLLRGKENLLVIEAKRDDLTRGFTQLAVEMVEMSCPYGALTTGTIWQFAKLEERVIYQDINLYRVPNDLEELIAILLGILGGKENADRNY